MIKLKSGETAPKSGSYNVVSRNGKVINSVNVEKGETMPPTQSSGNHFEIE